MEVGFIEVFPPRTAASRPPVLLQTLETQLLEATNAASRLASAGPHQHRDAKLAANLALDAHRQVFQTFIDGFGEVYRPLLGQIKQALDAAIEQGITDALDNSNLRQQLQQSQRHQAESEAATRADAIDGRQPQREQVYKALAAARARLDAALRRKDLADKDLHRAKSELERLRGLAKASRANKQRLVDAAVAEANWVAARPHAAALLGMTAGPLTPQEDEELEVEMGVALEAGSQQHPLERALQLLEKHDAAAAAKLLDQSMGIDTSRRRQLQEADQQKQLHTRQGVEPAADQAAEQQEQELEQDLQLEQPKEQVLASAVEAAQAVAAGLQPEL